MTVTDKLLIVDDNVEMHRLLRTHLAPEGYEMTYTEKAQEALDLLASGEFAVAILDLMLPGMSGVEMLKQLQDDPPRTQIIVLTAYASLKTAVETLRLGAYDYIAKPFYGDVIKSSVCSALEKYRLRQQLDEIETASRQMALLQSGQQVARSTLDVVRQVIEIPDCSLWALDETGATLYQPAEGDGSARLDLDGEGTAQKAMRSGRSLRCFGAGNRFELATPLEADGRVIGVLAIGGSQADALGPRDEMLLSTLAARAGVALESARRYERARRELADHQRAETALRDSEQRFRLLYEQAPLCYQALDEMGRLRQVNRAWVELLGYAPEEVIGRSFIELLTPESASRFQRCFAHLQAEGAVGGVELDLVRRDGARLTVRLDGRIGLDGAVRQVGCILQDVSASNR